MADVTIKVTLGNFAVEVSGPTEYVEKKIEEFLSRYASISRGTSPEPRVGQVALDAKAHQVMICSFDNENLPIVKTKRRKPAVFAGPFFGDLGRLRKLSSVWFF